MSSLRPFPTLLGRTSASLNAAHVKTALNKANVLPHKQELTTSMEELMLLKPLTSVNSEVLQERQEVIQKKKLLARTYTQMEDLEMLLVETASVYAYPKNKPQLELEDD